MNAQAQPCGTPPYKSSPHRDLKIFELQRNGRRGPHLIISQKDRRHDKTAGRVVAKKDLHLYFIGGEAGGGVGHGRSIVRATCA